MTVVKRDTDFGPELWDPRTNVVVRVHPWLYYKFVGTNRYQFGFGKDGRTIAMTDIDPSGQEFGLSFHVETTKEPPKTRAEVPSKIRRWMEAAMADYMHRYWMEHPPYQPETTP